MVRLGSLFDIPGTHYKLIDHLLILAEEIDF